MESEEEEKKKEEKGGESEDGVANAFARSGKLLRSPVSTPVPTASTSRGLMLSEIFTPKLSSGSQGQIGRTKLQEARNSVNELYEFIKDKNNVHTKIKQLVTVIKSCMTAAEREQSALRKRAEAAEKALAEVREEATLIQETPEGPRLEKRKRETPGEEEEQKKPKSDKDGNTVQGEGSGWRTVGSQKEKWKKKEEKKREDQKEKKEKPRARRERTKGDALVVEVKEGLSYADLLRKVRADPQLKELGDNVVKTRRTQKGEMLFELKKDPAVKSSAFKTLIEKSLGEEANVRALSQETVVECRNLDEITTAEELKAALIEQCDLGDVPMAIRMRKVYGSTQTASIRLSTVAANKLLAKGSVKVWWSVCSLKAGPRISKQMERCFKCMGFGHLARNCKGPDRTDLCRKCGEQGHIARDCKNPPRCMLCKQEDGNEHTTGSFKCPEYKKAMAS